MLDGKLQVGERPLQETHFILLNFSVAVIIIRVFILFSTLCAYNQNFTQNPNKLIEMNKERIVLSK